MIMPAGGGAEGRSQSVVGGASRPDGHDFVIRGERDQGLVVTVVDLREVANVALGQAFDRADRKLVAPVARRD